MERLINDDNKEFSNSISVLLVEDNINEVEITRLAFVEANLGINLNHVANGEEALEYLFKKGEFSEIPTPDLVLLDIDLPQINGMDVLHIIKTSDSLKSIPVIMLTTTNNDEAINEAYKLHANSYICKPLGFENFLKVIAGLNNYWVNISKLPNK